MRYFTSYLKKVILLQVTRVTCNALPPQHCLYVKCSVLTEPLTSAARDENENIFIIF